MTGFLRSLYNFQKVLTLFSEVNALLLQLFKRAVEKYSSHLYCESIYFFFAKKIHQWLFTVTICSGGTEPATPLKGSFFLMIFTSFYLSLFIIFICFELKETVEIQLIYISNLSNFSLRVYTGFSRKKKFLFGGSYQVWRCSERQVANCLRISSRADIFRSNYKAIANVNGGKLLFILVYSIIFPVFKRYLLWEI